MTRVTRFTGDIQVLDNNGVIPLKVTVPFRELSEAAETIAREVDGVTSVVNKIDVVSIGDNAMEQK